MVTAFRELDEDSHTVFTVLTGEGRFFSAGADIRGMSRYIFLPKELDLILPQGGIQEPPRESTAAQKKLFYMRKFSLGA